ncbi:Gamma interferon inducible lysosomal thiol reductase GILT [Parasponia andersonii]|uniref:Gamma interferon inducible lysosomal thiol reductase GILT n=1 Tax=Parasponia andersonii TaxID=3476 RepID=A0A2P5B111_PARAD|nr:Gamma interferon inducible lysosomal thiol reductase GILT [Parasponia andersonii]
MEGRTLLGILGLGYLGYLILFFSVNPIHGCMGYDQKVQMSLYYEALCPFCANFIVKHLAKLFQNGLISVVDLRMVPWGNAWINPNGSVHGADECLLNTMEACTIAVYPDMSQHFSFIHCVERLTLENRHSEWANCFQITGLDTVPIDCYNNGDGKVIEERYGKETAMLNPPHRYVPWVIVNNHPLQEDYQNFVAYICKAYRGSPKPKACRSLSTEIELTEKADSIPEVCYIGE